MSRTAYEFVWVVYLDRRDNPLVPLIQGMGSDGLSGTTLRFCEVRLSGRAVAIGGFILFERTLLFMSAFGCLDKPGIDRQEIIYTLMRDAVEVWNERNKIEIDTKKIESFAMTCWCFADWLAAHRLGRELMLWPAPRREDPPKVIDERERLFKLFHLRPARPMDVWSVEGEQLSLEHAPPHRQPAGEEWWLNTTHGQPRLCIGRYS